MHDDHQKPRLARRDHPCAGLTGRVTRPVSALVFAAMAGMATPALADDPPEAVQQLVSETAGDTPIRELSPAQFGSAYSDAIPGYFLVLDEGCESRAGCRWFAISAEGDPEILADMRGTEPELRHGPERDHVMSDHAGWTVTGNGIGTAEAPINTRDVREATEGEVALITGETRYSEPEHMDLQVMEGEFFGDGTEQRAFVVGGSFYRVRGSLSPYVIVDADDTIIETGLSADEPRIWPHPDGGAFTRVAVHLPDLDIEVFRR